jgi:hypothetical protein
MGNVVYVSESRMERRQGPLRIAHLPGEPRPVVFSVHGAIADHYKVNPASLTESHAATIDYVISATTGCGLAEPAGGRRCGSLRSGYCRRRWYSSDGDSFDTWGVASCDAKFNAEGLGGGARTRVDAIGRAGIRAGKRYEIGVPVLEELVREIAAA